jgi:hypothetical protein
MFPPMDTAGLTDAEERVCQAFSRREKVDFRRPGDAGAENGHQWAAERTVRAEVLRNLLLSGTAEEGEITGLLISGARVTGVLDLMYARIEHPIVLRVCHFDHAVILHGAQLRQLNLEWSYLPGLNASRIQVDGVLRSRHHRLRRRRARPEGPRRFPPERHDRFRDATPIEGLVNLRRAQIDMLYATPDVGPDVVSLDELTYTTLVPQLPAEQRLPLLEREELGYVPARRGLAGGAGLVPVDVVRADPGGLGPGHHDRRRHHPLRQPHLTLGRWTPPTKRWITDC